MTGGGQNKPDWSSKTSGGEMDTRSTTPDMAAAKVKPHADRADDQAAKGADAKAAKVSPEAAGAMKDQVGKGG